MRVVLPSPTMLLQPVVELTSGRIVGVEALARFPGRGAPDTVFAEAAARGRGVELERSALTGALALLPLLPDGVTLAVNLSAAALLDPEVRAEVLAVAPARTVVEVTEHEVVTDYSALLRALDLLRAHGVRLAVDDTGAGYASLRHVLLLQPEVVKLDRCLVAGLGASRQQEALVSGLALMCGLSGAALVAEGVEGPDEVAALLDLGVPFAQGFFLARPAPAAMVVAALLAPPEQPGGYLSLVREAGDHHGGARDRLTRARQRSRDLRSRYGHVTHVAAQTVAASHDVLQVSRSAAAPTEPGAAPLG